MDRQDITGRWGAQRRRPETSGPSPGELIPEKPQFLLRPVQSPLWPETLAKPQALVRCSARPGPTLAQPQLGPGEDSHLPGETVRSGRV